MHKGQTRQVKKGYVLLGSGFRRSSCISTRIWTYRNESVEDKLKGSRTHGNSIFSGRPMPFSFPDCWMCQYTSIFIISGQMGERARAPVLTQNRMRHNKRKKLFGGKNIEFLIDESMNELGDIFKYFEWTLNRIQIRSAVIIQKRLLLGVCMTWWNACAVFKIPSFFSVHENISESSLRLH